MKQNQVHTAEPSREHWVNSDSDTTLTRRLAGCSKRAAFSEPLCTLEKMLFLALS